MNRLLIVDGHAYAYRAFHAIRELRAPDGRPTNAIYGFVKMLEKMRQALQPTHLMVVWDGGLSAERTAALPEYKAHRPAMPADLRPQFDEIEKYLAAAGVAGYRGDGVEADDYLGTLARRCGSPRRTFAATSGWCGCRKCRASWWRNNWPSARRIAAPCANCLAAGDSGECRPNRMRV